MEPSASSEITQSGSGYGFTAVFSSACKDGIIVKRVRMAVIKKGFMTMHLTIPIEASHLQYP
ncbi:MAG: hypothetical protein EBS96_11975 [Spartobacteria bacterium]|jgi:hypothetical protein|nr:hypothetical protein [Spartobacteria bacterium]